MAKAHLSNVLRSVQGKRSSLSSVIQFRGYSFDVPKQVRIPEFGGLAQLGERLPCKQGVSGSIPLVSTT